MRGKQLLPVGLLVLGACSAAKDGGINVGVAVEELTATENFCFTWKLYEQTNGAWALIDQRGFEVCAGAGVDSLSDYATCTDGRRFLVEYNVTFYEGMNVIGTAIATSGGTESDVCMKNTDKPTMAHLQFRNEGNKGGVNPGLDVDQVCTNDKLVIENGKIVSAVWVQPDSCEGEVPDDFCSLGYTMSDGTGLDTKRYGLTADGLTRFIFSEADPATADFGMFYLAFDPGLAADTLYLYNAPWVLVHSYVAEVLNRAQYPAYASFRYNSSMGIIYNAGGGVGILFDTAASCNGPVALDAQLEPVEWPVCAGGGDASFAGVIPTGGSTFQIVFECAGGHFSFVSCDAAGVEVDGGTSICSIGP